MLSTHHPIGASFACDKKHEVSNLKLIPTLHKNFIEQHIEPLSTLFNVVMVIAHKKIIRDWTVTTLVSCLTLQNLHGSLLIHQGPQITSMCLTQIWTTITKRRKFGHLPTSRPTSFQVKFVDSRHVSKNETLTPKFARNCLAHTAIHENVCGYATMSFFAVGWTCWSRCVSIPFFLLKSGWNGIEMDIENGCRKLGHWKLIRTNRRCVGDASMIVVCSWWHHPDVHRMTSMPLWIRGRGWINVELSLLM